MDTFTKTTTFVVVTCCCCGIQFGMTERFQERLIENQEYFYCPNGHLQHYTESKETILKRRLKNSDEIITFWKNQEQIVRNSLRAVKGQVTKLKKRVVTGQCPCCDKSFANLKKHMEKIHPDFVEVEKDAQNN